MESLLPKVLILEPMEALQNLWKAQLKGKIEILSAFTPGEAHDIFTDDTDIVAVVITCRNEVLIPSVKELIVYMTTTKFKGPIIVMSSRAETLKAFTETLKAFRKGGANHELDNKMEFAVNLLDTLGIK